MRVGDGRRGTAGDPAGVRVSTDRADVDLDWLVAVPSEQAYWALGRSPDAIKRSVAASLCFSALRGDRQVGFARVVTDEATFG